MPLHSPGSQWACSRWNANAHPTETCNLAAEAQLRQPPEFSNTIVPLGRLLVKDPGQFHNSPTHLSAFGRLTERNTRLSLTPLWHSTFSGRINAVSQMQLVCCWCRVQLTDGWPLPKPKATCPRPRRDNKPRHFFRTSLARRDCRTRYFGPNLCAKIAHHTAGYLRSKRLTGWASPSLASPICPPKGLFTAVPEWEASFYIAAFSVAPFGTGLDTRCYGLSSSPR